MYINRSPQKALSQGDKTATPARFLLESGGCRICSETYSRATPLYIIIGVSALHPNTAMRDAYISPNESSQWIVAKREIRMHIYCHISVIHAIIFVRQAFSDILRYTFESCLSLCKCSKKAQPRCPEISAVYPICCTLIYSVKKYPFPFVSMPLT